MTNEEFERTKEFILQQQAQFASDVIELRQFQSETWGMLSKTVQVVDLLSITVRDGFKTIIDRQDESIKERKELREGQVELKLGLNDVNAKIDALVDAQIRTDEQQKRTDEQLRRTDEQLRRTDEQLRRTDEQQQRTEKQLLRTEQAVKRNAQEIRRTNQEVRRTTLEVRKTTKNLNTLTKLVNRNRKRN